VKTFFIFELNQDKLENIMKEFLLIIAVIGFGSCSSGSGEADGDSDSTATDSVEVTMDTDLVEPDTSSLTVVGEEPMEEELQELSRDVFCECVRKKHAIEKKLELVESDEEIDALLEELDVIDEGECKNLLAGTQSSAQAQAEHKQKVAACLQ